MDTDERWRRTCAASPEDAVPGGVLDLGGEAAGLGHGRDQLGGEAHALLGLAHELPGRPGAVGGEGDGLGLGGAGQDGDGHEGQENPFHHDALLQ
jgi:hypothetical protein